MARLIPGRGGSQRDGPDTVRQKRRRFRLRLLVGTMIAGAVLALGAYLWHARQVARTAAALLQQADDFQQQGNWQRAAECLHRYLQFRPDDAVVQVRLAETFDKAATHAQFKLRAVELYRSAMDVAPADQRPGLHGRLTELLLEVEDFSSAEIEAKKLLEANVANPLAHKLLALAHYGLFQSEDAATASGGNPSLQETFLKALELNPGDIELSAAMARVYRRQLEFLNDQNQDPTDTERKELAEKRRQLADKADAVVDEMVEQNPENPEAFLARYLYRLQYEVPGAGEDLQLALQHGRDSLKVRLAAAEHARREAERARQEEAPAEEVDKYLGEARRHYEYIIEKLAPSDERAYLGLGEVHLAQDEVDLAVETWRRGLEAIDGQSLLLNLRLAEVLVGRKRWDEAEEVLDTLEGTVKKLGPGTPQAARTSLGGAVKLLRGRWLCGRGDYRLAIPLLEGLTAGPRDSPDGTTRVLQSWLLLGGARGALGQWDQAAAAYERALDLAPRLVQAQRAAAAAWMAARRPDAAIRRYEQALRLEDDPETWLALAGARFQRQVRLPQDQRNWQRFSQVLAQVKAPERKGKLNDPWRLDLLEADYQLARGLESGPGNAKGLLLAAEKAYPDSPELLRALVLAYQRLGSATDADRALASFEGIADDPAAPCLLRSELCLLRNQSDQARQALEEGLETLPPEAHPALRQALFQLSLGEGDLDSARQQLLRLHKTAPSDVGLMSQLAAMAFEKGNLAEVETWEKALQDAEGQDGSIWRYFRARRLLQQAEDAGDPRLTEAAQLQDEIRRQRPAWPLGHVLGGLLAERRGNLRDAIDAYQQAIRLGEQGVAVYERLVPLLYQAGLLDQARQCLSQVESQVPSSQRLSGAIIALAVAAGQLDQALDAARRGTDTRPEDPVAWLWLGQRLHALEQAEEAEKAFRRAVELAPGDSRVAGALLGFYLPDQPDRARETLKELAGNERLSEVQRALLLAQGYQLLDDRENARAAYRKALELAPDNADVLMQTAVFFSQTDDPLEAEKLLRRVLKLAPGTGEARRRLANILAARGGEKEWQEATRLLEQSGAGPEASHLDRRLQAVLFAQRAGEENLTKARQLLEELIADPQNTVDGDRLLLARVYERQGRLQAARSQYVSLVARPDPNPQHLATYVDFLLRHDSAGEATAWLKKLEAAAPGLRTAGLRARWLEAYDRTSEIEPLVKGVATKLAEAMGDDQQQQAELALAVGEIYTAAGQHQLAEQEYRRLLELDPHRYGPLAMSLAQQGRAKEAVDLCMEAAKTDTSAKPAITLAAVLVSGRPTAEALRRAEPFLVEAAQQHNDSAELLLSLANLRVVQQRTNDAVKLYRQLLGLNPRHLLALNNLATLLCESGRPADRQEALKYIGQAIDITGPQAALLDTKATILLHDGKADQAVPLLEEASTSGDDPRYDFHLAVAYHRLGDDDKARTALETAEKGKLEAQVLTPTDRKLLQELREALHPPQQQ